MTQSFAVSQVKAAVKAFEAAQAKHRKLGASDTEPDGAFQACIARALHGQDPKIPGTAHQWSLFSRMNGIRAASRELHDRTQAVVAAIEKVTVKDIDELTKYLTDYCWRITM